jgi:hypothetical protein
MVDPKRGGTREQDELAHLLSPLARPDVHLVMVRGLRNSPGFEDR